MSNIIPAEIIEKHIFFIRDQKVMLDKDLAELYGVKTKVLNQAVKRNINRFPSDFMFHLTENERNEVVTICDHLKDLKYSYQNPYAFTEHGILMLSSVLNSKRAIQVNIEIMRTFTRLQKMLFTYHGLQSKIEALEKKYDKQFKVVFSAIKAMIAPPSKPKGDFGFRPRGG
ncbi:ORF6N domain-containing protein [Candidatus Saganbacteria bacterium]|nr:ORF6N domain-containing protein [Candidatus Saganbacteria bacterium]